MKKLNTILYKFSPPILISLLRRLNYKIKLLRDTDIQNYNSEILAKSIVAKNLMFSTDSNYSPDVKIDSVMLTASMWLYTLSRNKHPTRILDFGGGGGGHYFQCKGYLDSDFKKWIVIETPELVNECKNLEIENLEFFTFKEFSDLEQAKVDIVFSSCALQYTPDPIEHLQELLKLEAPVICLSRVALSLSHKNQSLYEFSKLSGNGPGIITEKNNDLNVKYRSVAISRKIFEELIAKHYKIVLRMDHGASNAHLAAAVRGVSLVSYVAVLNPNLSGIPSTA